MELFLKKERGNDRESKDGERPLQRAQGVFDSALAVRIQHVERLIHVPGSAFSSGGFGK